jgi:hypothetical protein
VATRPLEWEGPGQDLLHRRARRISDHVQGRPITREALVVQGDPFYVPPYVGDKGWVGIRSKHTRTGWEEVAELIATSYCLVARRQLAARVTSPPPLDS